MAVFPPHSGVIDRGEPPPHNKPMPHRTIFQWGKDHAHPFTVFMGGLVIGTLVTGAVAWAWVMAEDADVEFETVITEPAANETASPKPSVSPSATPSSSSDVQF